MMHAAETYFVGASLEGVPVDPDSDPIPFLAEEDLP